MKMSEGAFLVGFVFLQRMAELFLSARNAKGLMARGGVEFGQGHYPVMAAVMMMWLVTLALFGATRPVDIGWLAVFIVLQMARVWVIATLGERWTTRVIVVPGLPLVKTGPYRYLRHPNYWIVIAEIVVVPLCLGLWWHAALSFVVIGAVLWVRIRCEEKALQLESGSVPQRA
jgi:methyltransferase